MEMGSELSKTVATFIVQKILLDSVSPLPFAFMHDSLLLAKAASHLRTSLSATHLPVLFALFLHYYDSWHDLSRKRFSEPASLFMDHVGLPLPYSLFAQNSHHNE